MKTLLFPVFFSGAIASLSIFIFCLFACGQPQPAQQQVPAPSGVAPEMVQSAPDTPSASVATPGKGDTTGSIPRGIPMPQKDFKKMKKDAEKLGPAEKGDADQDEDH